MSSSSPIEIQYAPPLPWHRTRQTRRVLYFVVAVIVLAGGFHYWPMIRRAPSQLYWERKARNYTAPAGMIIYSNDPQDITLFGVSAGYVTSFKGWKSGTFLLAPNQTFQKLVSVQVGRPTTPAPAIFLHGRQSPSGVERLVAVQFGRMSSADPFNRLFLTPYLPQTVFGRTPAPAGLTGQLEMCLAAGDRVRIYDGQPDPNDQSHFTIDYDLNGQRGTIDGKLGDNGAVSLIPRIGKFVLAGGTGWWSPAGAPMPQWLNGLSPSGTTQPAR